MARVQSSKCYTPGIYITSSNVVPSKPRKTFTPEAPRKRQICGGKVRFGFIPDEWFTFFYPMTGISGPYFFGLVLTNYLVSKEIFVMEHEYYTGVSIFVIVYYATTRFGNQIGKSLDVHVDKYAADFDKIRADEIQYYKDIVNECQTSQLQAQAQKFLMMAKKENVAMQLEAVYRHRMMQAYQIVKSRLDYQVQVKQYLTRLHQRWMIQWILENVLKSITPDLEKKFINSAIRDLALLADSVNKSKK